MKVHRYILIVILLLWSNCFFSQEKKQTDRGIKPIVRYELSGGAGHYDYYAPSAIIDKYGICYMYLCENRDPFKIVDYIYLYKGIWTKTGFIWQPGTMVLHPSESGWDDCHVCDPDVREFRCRYKGETYDWIMTYLGVDRWDCNHNQIGLAVSKNIEVPWIKFEHNPIVSYQDTTKWGVGQSTTIVLDSTTIRLFYHKSGAMVCRDIKLNNLENLTFGEEKLISNIKPNAYFAYSSKNIYMVSEVRINMSSEIPTWVGNYVRFAYQPIGSDIHTIKDNWIEIGYVGPKDSGFPRNHNPGFLTDTKGYLTSDDKITVFFTPAMTGNNWLWSYDLYSAIFNFKKSSN